MTPQSKCCAHRIVTRLLILDVLLTGPETQKKSGMISMGVHLKMKMRSKRNGIMMMSPTTGIITTAMRETQTALKTPSQNQLKSHSIHTSPVIVIENWIRDL